MGLSNLTVHSCSAAGVRLHAPIISSRTQSLVGASVELVGVVGASVEAVLLHRDLVGVSVELEDLEGLVERLVVGAFVEAERHGLVERLVVGASRGGSLCGSLLWWEPLWMPLNASWRPMLCHRLRTPWHVGHVAHVQAPPSKESMMARS